MRIRTTLATGAVVGALVASTAVMPAFAAATATITDPKGDVVTTTTDATTGAQTSAPADYPAADIRKVKAKRTATRLLVTIKLSLVKKDAGDTASVLIRTSKTAKAKYSITVSREKPKVILVTTKSGIKVAKKTITFHTKPGVDSTITFAIDEKWFGNAKKVSVAALLTHVQTTPTVSSTVDATGVVTPTKTSLKWTKFISAAK
jgi:hypothetical protein